MKHNQNWTRPQGYGAGVAGSGSLDGELTRSDNTCGRLEICQNRPHHGSEQSGFTPHPPSTHTLGAWPPYGHKQSVDRSRARGQGAREVVDHLASIGSTAGWGGKKPKDGQEWAQLIGKNLRAPTGHAEPHPTADDGGPWRVGSVRSRAAIGRTSCYCHGSPKSDHSCE